ncbi:MAG: Lrp/AsnC family transcriptional regulator [Nanoarchaeota archaeon]|nr:Lrp/AsnC family transcriptional regulator [Nanoarchaeota archaeon]
MDATDRKILNVLIKNGRLSYRQIAKRIGVSVATVMNRVNKLEHDGIVNGYTTTINYDKLGYELHVLIELRIAKGKLLEVEKRVATNVNVLAVYDHTGISDCTVLARFRNKRSLDVFIKELQTFDFVEQTHTKLILNTLKEGPMLVR